MFIIPINRDNPLNHIPWVLSALMVVNTAVLAATYFLAEPQQVFATHGFVPAQPHAWNLFASMFLHAGIWHLLGNMWFLWMFGNKVEHMFGPFFLPAYLICGLGGHALHYAFNSSSAIPCVGASGAISGIVGIYFVLFPKSKFDLSIYYGWFLLKTVRTRTHAAVGAWVVEQSVLGLLTLALPVAAVAFWAHIGGFVAGVALGLFWQAVIPAKTRWKLEHASHWYMEDSVNREDDTITRLKL